MEWESHNVRVTDFRKTTDVPGFVECDFKWINYQAKTIPYYDEESIITCCDEMISLLHSHIEAALSIV
jgi:hypothetical protein